MALLIDGELNEVWMDPNMKEGRFGTALHFIAMNSLPTRVSKIAVKPWDGEIDAAPNNMMGRGRLRARINPPAPKPSKEDEDEKNKNLMKLANGDSITGEVNKIENGIASLKTPLGELSIPVSRLRTLALKQLGKSEPKIENGDIRVGFADGSSLVFKLEKVENGKIIGSNQTFGINSERGTEAFDMSTISRIEFNLYEEDYKNIRNQETW